MEGLAYRLMPYGEKGSQGFVNTEIMYERMMKGMFWRNLDKENIYYDENYRRFPYNARLSFYKLAGQLYNEGQIEKAKEVVYECLKVIPDKTIPYDITAPQFISILIKCGDKTKALEMADVLAKRADEELNYYMINNIKNEMEVQTNLYLVNQLAMIFKTEGMDKEADKYAQILLKYTGSEPE
jgi:tetratricopeptide (TPR) repeat protein